jgi:hypothetical protein
MHRHWTGLGEEKMALPAVALEKVPGKRKKMIK